MVESRARATRNGKCCSGESDGSSNVVLAAQVVMVRDDDRVVGGAGSAARHNRSTTHNRWACGKRRALKARAAEYENATNVKHFYSTHNLNAQNQQQAQQLISDVRLVSLSVDVFVRC